ncbi:hypothetical protein LTR85_010369 [Meristemomyces frigidus]|nr:hypothetical protein LTR85_010369 [Meristemomyces frigidus]
MPGLKRTRSLSPTTPPPSKRPSLRSTRAALNKTETPTSPTTSLSAPETPASQTTSPNSPEPLASRTTAQTSSPEMELPLSPTIAPRGGKGGTISRTVAPAKKPSMASATAGAASITKSSEAAGELPVEAAVAAETSTRRQRAIYGTRTVAVTNDKKKKQMLLRVENLDPLQLQFIELAVSMLDRPDVMEGLMKDIGK